jgi:diguanylate cyclase (GGDEF)-like protein
MARAPAWLVTGGAIVVMAAVGFVDLLTDPNLGFSSLYVLPVLIASWRGPRAAGMALATIGAVIWTLAPVPHLPETTLAFVSLWNLVVRLTTLALVAWLVGELRTQLALAERSARTDHLTGLATRGWFLEHLAREVERAQRYAHPLTIAYIDIDDFKPVNDKFGHRAGDLLLQRIARTLQEQVRDFDLAGRLGGDEFMLLLLETGTDHARATIERLAEALRGATRDEGHPVTFSIGVLTYQHPPNDPSAAMVQADELMYEVKRGGKDGVLHRVFE